MAWQTITSHGTPGGNFILQGDTVDVVEPFEYTALRARADLNVEGRVMVVIFRPVPDTRHVLQMDTDAGSIDTASIDLPVGVVLSTDELSDDRFSVELRWMSDARRWQVDAWRQQSREFAIELRQRLVDNYSGGQQMSAQNWQTEVEALLPLVGGKVVGGTLE